MDVTSIRELYYDNYEGLPFEEIVQAIYEKSLEEYMDKKPNSYRQKLLERLGLK